MNFRGQTFLLLLSILVLSTAGSARAADVRPVPGLSTNEIVEKLSTANARRAEMLRGYHGKRVYRLDYHGLFGSHDAEIQVEATYIAPDRKSFKVISESGSHLLINRVLLRLLSSEEQAQQEANRKALEVNSQNYDFVLDGIEHTPGGDCYVLDVKPKGKSAYLYRGKIWVDAHDFAIARMAGEPQKNPSIWVSHTEVEYRWAPKDGFWLPIRNQSITQVRMGGRANLTIDYSDYEITGARQANAGQRNGSAPSLPDPSTVTVDPH